MAGRRIDDHSFWAGGKGKNTVFPDGPYKTKEEHSDGHSGELSHYEDTTEAIAEQQMLGEKKVRGLPRKETFRN